MSYSPFHLDVGCQREEKGWKAINKIRHPPFIRHLLWVIWDAAVFCLRAWEGSSFPDNGIPSKERTLCPKAIKQADDLLGNL